MSTALMSKRSLIKHLSDKGNMYGFVIDNRLKNAHYVQQQAVISLQKIIRNFEIDELNKGDYRGQDTYLLSQLSKEVEIDSKKYKISDLIFAIKDVLNGKNR